ncbi:MAG: TolC family protein [Gammaproteobacteria bacterium]|nr:TolC family protein [Gammaproteobacteria bacterium]
MIRKSFLSLLLAVPGLAVAEPLPDPLTLDHALSLAANHPDVAVAEARYETSKAEADLVDAQNGFRVELYLNPRYADPYNDDSDSGYINDSMGSLSVRKRVYDFGRNSSKYSAARSRSLAHEAELLNTGKLAQLRVMRYFFDVLLADLRYMYDNEFMAHKYVRFDKARERKNLGQLSEVDVLEHETVYQDALIIRTRSQAAQSNTRARLAAILGRSGELPANVMRPEMKAVVARELPEYQKTLEEVRQHSKLLAAARLELAGAEADHVAARARRYPVLDAAVSANRYEREIGNRDSGSVELQLRVPIYQGGLASAEIASADARVRQASARLRAVELQLEQHVLDLVQRVEVLKVRVRAARVRLDYRDLVLDRNRALYEMEAQTTLGDSMAGVTEAQWQAAEAEFELVLAWAELDALRGRQFDQFQEEGK